uniref:Uncharacterized protein n=2 Tax=Micrurus TaxID=8634 RepID=A0A2D4HLT5_MICLE
MDAYNLSGFSLLLRLDGIQDATEEELRIFQSTNGIYDVAKLSMLGIQLLTLPCRKRKAKSAKTESMGTGNVRSNEHGKLNTVKDAMNQLYTNILDISELKWTGI